MKFKINKKNKKIKKLKIIKSKLKLKLKDIFELALHLHEDGLGLPTVFAAALFAEVSVQDLIGWNSGIGNPLLSS